MKRIGYIISTLEGKRPVNVMYNIIKYLDFSKYEVYIYTLSQEKKKSRIDEFIKIGCKIKKIDIKNSSILLGKVKSIENILRDDKIDVIHSHCFRSTLLISKIKEISKVVTIHSTITEDYKFYFGYVKGKIMEKLFFSSLKNIEQRICCAESVKAYLKNKLHLNLDFIQNGVDLEKFKIEGTKKEIRQKLKLPENKRIFLMVGSLCKRKDPIFVAKKISEKKNEDDILVLLGDGIQKENILKLKNKNIIVLGNVKNVNEYLNACDYYISSSYSEGLPNSVLEALALKVPVILSNIPSHLEILKIKPEAGVIFKKEEKESFNLAVQKIKSRDYKMISEIAYSIVRDELNAQKMSEKYCEKYFKKLV